MRTQLLGHMIFVLILTSACGGQENTEIREGLTSAQTACYDLYDWAFEKAYECMDAPANEKEKARQTAKKISLAYADAVCPYVTKIKNEELFYNQCLDWIGTVTCEDLSDGSLVTPDFCDDQFVVSY